MAVAETFIQYAVERKSRCNGGKGAEFWYRTFFTEPSSNPQVTDEWLKQLKELIAGKEDQYRIIIFARTTVTAQIIHSDNEVVMYTPTPDSEM